MTRSVGDRNTVNIISSSSKKKMSWPVPFWKVECFNLKLHKKDWVIWKKKTLGAGLLSFCHRVFSPHWEQLKNDTGSQKPQIWPHMLIFPPFSLMYARKLQCLEFSCVHLFVSSVFFFGLGVMHLEHFEVWSSTFVLESWKSDWLEHSISSREYKKWMASEKDCKLLYCV